MVVHIHPTLLAFFGQQANDHKIVLIYFDDFADRRLVTKEVGFEVRTDNGDPLALFYFIVGKIPTFLSREIANAFVLRNRAHYRAIPVFRGIDDLSVSAKLRNDGCRCGALFP